MEFSKWKPEIHETKDQKKRIASAKSSKTTPHSIDRESKSGVFFGSGSTPYQTTLDTCTCFDFSHRKLPCKHMYRLAIELGLLGEDSKEELQRETKELQIAFDDAVAELENLPDADQKVIKEFLYQHLYGDATEYSVLADKISDNLPKCPLLEQIDAPNIALQTLRRNQIIKALDAHDISGFKRNMSLKDLAAWCSENVSDIWDVFPRVYVFRFSNSFQNSHRKVYSYLRRKYDWDYYYDEDMKKVRYPFGGKFADVCITFSDGVKYQSGGSGICFFPDDDVTRLLTFYGHNRCLNGFDTLE